MISLPLAALALICGLIASSYSWRALGTPVQKVGNPNTVDPQMMLGGWVFGAIASIEKAALLNRVAVLWTIASAMLSAGASVAAAIGS